MRFVRRKLVLRLNRDPGDELVERLNSEFRDIIESGRIVKSAPLPLESDDKHLHDLPRLVFNFNRKEIGRLRQMIDAINDAGWALRGRDAGDSGQASETTMAGEKPET
jgi:hypothetical protein